MTETELYKAIEHHYGSGILMAFTDLIHEEIEMIIDHKLAEEIGATHYYENNSGGYNLIDIKSAKLKEVGSSYFDVGKFIRVDANGDVVDLDSIFVTLDFLLENAKPIESTSPTRTKVSYERVTESIFDLKDKFERGELLLKIGDSYEALDTTNCLINAILAEQCYRKVEVEMTERDEFIERGISECYVDGAGTENLKVVFGAMFDAGCRFK